ncbi:uncharacterized protein LOC129229440 [Uloborus diversus]|uniref:uncharacterized protein LOC129229440 n=1 Tax=Uloborus diversus TaxID=327109 RepID=UPI00240A4DB8|nr:uncharacterized protein LOC129229440 [Uloborus diversus]
MTHSQSTHSPSKSSKICSVLRVDKEVDFLLDEDDITYLATVPTTRTIEDSRKNYSKNSLTYNPCISFLEPSIEKNEVTDKKKSMSCSSSLYTGKNNPKKRKPSTITNSYVNIAKRLKRDNIRNNKPSLRNNGSQLARVKFKTERNRSSDPDVKIIKVFTPSQSRSSVSGKRVVGLKNGIRGKTIVTKFNNNLFKQKPAVKQVPQVNCKPFSLADDGNSINEADTAPLIGPELYSDMCSNEAVCDVSSSPQNKWLSTNGSTDVSLFPNGNSGIEESPTSSSDKSDGSFETKTIVSRRKPREIDQLYANLNEISWAHEHDFKKLLNNDEMKNTRKATAISLGTNQGRILRNIQELKAKNRNVKKVARPKGKLNRVLKAKQSIQNKNVLLNNIQQRNSSSMVKHADKIKKRIYQDIKMKAKNDKVPSAKSKLNKSLKTNGPKKIAKKTNAALKPKFRQGVKVKMGAGVKKNKILKTTVNGTNKKAQCLTKMKDIKPKVPAVKTKLLNSKVALKQAMSTNLMLQKKEMPESSGVSLQKFNKKNCTKSETCTVSSNKTTVIKSAIKKFEQVEISNQIDLFKRFLGEDSNLFSALQQGSKLRVSLEPLEHTSHWNSTFYEEFKNQVLTQAFCKTLEMENQDSLHSMFRNLDEVIFNQKNDDKMSKKRKTEEESLRSSVRQIEGSYRYKEIVVKRHKCYLQVVIVPNVSKRNCLSIETMKELKEAFLLAKKDSTLRAVLLSSSGPYFCGGIDLSQLIGDYKRQMAEEMSLVMRDLILAISSVSKPIIAAVNGCTIGFGVAILALCDIVLASDKATFCIPATKLGYVPEGGLSLTLPQVIGSGRACELLLQGRRFTAAQGLSYGFVSEIMWPTRLMNDLIPRLDNLLSHPPQAMEATKSMVRSHLWDKLKAQIEKEWRMLPPLWLSAECQNNMKKMLKTGWLDD